MRSATGIESLVRSGVPGTAIGEPDLAFTAAETAHLLRTVDPSMSDLDVVVVHQRLGGWPLPTTELVRLLAEPEPPSLVLACGSAPSLTACAALDAATSDHDLEMVGPLSLVRNIDADIAALLLDELHPDEHCNAALLLDRLGRSGVLVPVVASQPHDRHPVLRWSPHIRSVVHDDFARRHADKLPLLETALAYWYADHDTPDLALTHAANALQWDLMISL